MAFSPSYLFGLCHCLSSFATNHRLIIVCIIHPQTTSMEINIGEVSNGTSRSFGIIVFTEAKTLRFASFAIIDQPRNNAIKSILIAITEHMDSH